MGKSAAGVILQSLGIPVLDADDLARDLVTVGETAYVEIVAEFGHGILAADGTLDRAALAEKVFSDSALRAQLEQILHPRICARWTAWLDLQTGHGAPAAAVLIPLLLEKNYLDAFDASIAVVCSKLTQAHRLSARGWNPDHVGARIGSQMPAEEKMNLCRFAVWTEGAMSIHRRQWIMILRRLGGTSLLA
jgi:dephospho-CoA kinase